MQTAPEVNDLIGRPYVRGARGPDAFDCWGLVVELARRAGRDLPDWAADGLTRPQARALMRGEASACTVLLAAPTDGAIAFSERAAHCGYCLAGRVVHAMRGAGVVSWPLAMWRYAHPDGTWHAWPT